MLLQSGLQRRDVGVDAQVLRLFGQNLEGDVHVRLTCGGVELRHGLELGHRLVREDGVDGVGAHLREHVDEGLGRQLVKFVDHDPPRRGPLILGPLDDLDVQKAQNEVAEFAGGQGTDDALVEVDHHQLPGVEPLLEFQRALRLVEHPFEIGGPQDVAQAGVGRVDHPAVFGVGHLGRVEDILPILPRVEGDVGPRQQGLTMPLFMEAPEDVHQRGVARAQHQRHALGEDLVDGLHDRRVVGADVGEKLGQGILVDLKQGAVGSVEGQGIERPVPALLDRLVRRDVDHPIYMLGPFDDLLRKIALDVEQQHPFARIRELLKEVALEGGLAEARLADDVDAPQLARRALHLPNDIGARALSRSKRHHSSCPSADWDRDRSS